jgi:transposase
MSHPSEKRRCLSKKERKKKDITIIPESFLDDLAIERWLRQVRKWAIREK